MRPMSKSAAAYRRLSVMSAVLIMALAAGGCSGDDDEDSKGSSSSTSDSPGSESSVPSGDNGDLENPVGARNDLVDFKCAKHDGKWSASGTVKNATDDDTTYLVQVSVHSAETGTVVGSKDDTLDVKAGKKVDFDFGNIYSGDDKNLECTPRVVRSS